ncbi:hypothetical protein BC829DRAFT_384290, partial [Chytridium lagenaria]
MPSQNLNTPSASPLASSFQPSATSFLPKTLTSSSPPGLASFLIAHLFYIGAYESRTPSLRLNMGASIFAVSGLL